MDCIQFSVVFHYMPFFINDIVYERSLWKHICERVFSNVRKIRTDFRASMKADTLEAICIMKMHMQERKTQCYKQVYSIEETNQAKKSTMQYLAKCD